MKDTQNPPCQVPPTGWKCSRAAGHDGPCAASLAPQTSTNPTTGLTTESNCVYIGPGAPAVQHLVLDMGPVTAVVNSRTQEVAALEARATTAENYVTFLEQNERAYLALLGVDSTQKAVQKIGWLLARVKELEQAA